MGTGVEHIGPYEIRGRLGQGAMAVVWLGYDLSLAREVAIKEPLAPPFGDAEARTRFAERFVREARAAAGLNHPGIVTIHSTATYEGRPVIVMECVEGPTLRQVLDRRRLTAEEAYAVMEGLLDAVAFAHSRGVVHRDLKPDNVFITPAGAVKLADFGVARMAEDATLTRDGAIIGTPAYMSPEQVLGHEVTASADVFALGSIAWELLCGAAPFSGPSGTHVVTVLHRIVNGDLPQDVSCEPPAGPLLAVARQALSVASADRYPDAGAMLAAWRAAAPPKADAPRALAGLAAALPERPPVAPPGFGTWPGPAETVTAPVERVTHVEPSADVTLVDVTSPLPAGRRRRRRALIAAVAVAVTVAGVAGAYAISRLPAPKTPASAPQVAEPTVTVVSLEPALRASASRTKVTGKQEFSVAVSVEGTSLPDGTVVLLERSTNGKDWGDAKILRLASDAARTKTSIGKTTYFRFATLGDSQTAPISSEVVRVKYVKPRTVRPSRPGSSSGGTSSTDTSTPPDGSADPGTGGGTDTGGSSGSGEPSATP